MAKYIDLVLTADGIFCIAPAWTIKEGDYVSVVNQITGVSELKKVIATVTESVDGDYIKMIKAYVGCELAKVTQKYRGSELYWDGEENDAQP